MIQFWSMLIGLQKWSIIKYLKVIINVPNIVKVIFDIVVLHDDILDLIITNKSLLLTLKFWSLLCYFYGIKQKFSTVFDLQIDDLIQ